MQYQHLFILDPIASLNLPLDSSLRMMFALAKKGHRTYYAEMTQLSWHSGRMSAQAEVREVTFDKDAVTPSFSASSTRLLKEFHGIHMRKDPPYDLQYMSCTWLLDSAHKYARIYNSPSALRSFNEKLGIFHFPQYTAPVLVSSNADEILSFMHSTAKSDIVVKPLTLFGGQGVIRIPLDDPRGTNRETLDQETQHGTNLRLVQPFDKGIYDGELRVFSAFGEPISWCLKRPATGEFLANTRAGATLHPYTPKPSEEEMIKKVATELTKRGIYLVGFDVIGGKLSEINITSPRLLTAPGDREPYYERIAELMISDLETLLP